MYNLNNPQVSGRVLAVSKYYLTTVQTRVEFMKIAAVLHKCHTQRGKERERERKLERRERGWKSRQHLRIVVGKFHFQLAVFAIFACIRQSVWLGQSRGQLGVSGTGLLLPKERVIGVWRLEAWPVSKHKLC